MKTFARLSLCLAALALASAAPAAEFKLAAHTFTVPDGFTVELVAATPLVDRPIVADFDERGRLYVADSSGSNDKPEKQLVDKPHRIVRLEDTDGDGRFDKTIVFADRMMFPEGAMFFDGSLYVAAPPSIWKLTDTDGDGTADKRVEWFQGRTLTGCANDLHGPYAGPDGWIYWCKGAFAKQTHERPGKTPLVTRAAHIFRARPDGTGREAVMTGGMDNPVDVAFTPEGERIFTTTFFQHPGGGQRDGLIHAIYGGVYGKPNDVLDDHKKTGDLMPVLTHLGPAAPSGLTRYASGAFGREYENNLFACCFNLHKVTRHVLTPNGATFKTADSDFLVSDNTDFHPTDVIEDADGSLLVIDTGGWYKLCCPTSQLPKPDVLGAIYRVRRAGAPPIADARGLKLPWDKMKPAELAKLLGDDRPAVRQRAIHLLGKNGSAAVPALTAMVKKVSAAAGGARDGGTTALTPALSPGERENRRTSLDHADGAVAVAATPPVARQMGASDLIARRGGRFVAHAFQRAGARGFPAPRSFSGERRALAQGASRDWKVPRTRSLERLRYNAEGLRSTDTPPPLQTTEMCPPHILVNHPDAPIHLAAATVAPSPGGEGRGEGGRSPKKRAEKNNGSLSTEARRSAVWALTRIDAPAARAGVRAALRDHDAGVRHPAILAAGLWRDAGAVTDLLAALRSDSPHLQRAAAEALGRIGGQNPPQITLTNANIKAARTNINVTDASVKATRASIKAARASTKATGVSVKDADANIKVTNTNIKDARASVKDARAKIKATGASVKATRATIKATGTSTKDAEAATKVNPIKIQRQVVPALLAAAALAPDRTLEHSIIYALIEIADPAGTAAGLQAASPLTQKAALIALDQMDGSPLTAQIIMRYLSSTSAVVRAAAMWVAARHADWGDALADYFNTLLHARDLGEAAGAELVPQLSSFGRSAAMQKVLADILNQPGDPPHEPRRLIALRAMAKSGVKEPPAVWLAALETALRDSAPAVAREAVATARALPLTKAHAVKLAPELLRLARTTTLPDALRLDALAALPGGAAELDAALFDFLRANLAPLKPVAARGNAAAILARARLNAEQLLALTDALQTAGPMEVPRLLGAFEKSSDEALGLKLVAALERSAGLSALRAETLAPRLTNFPMTVRERGDALLATLNTDAPKQRAHLAALAAEMKGGDIRRGQALFNSAKTACSACHAIGYLGGTVGPDLTRIGQIRTERDLLEAIVYPSASFVRSYEPVLVQTRDGEAHNGVLRRDAPDEVVLATGPNVETRIARADIAQMRPGAVSVMPQGLDEQLSRQELADLMAFLRATRW